MPYAPGTLYRDGGPLVLDSGDYPAALDSCVSAIGYHEFRKAQASAREQGRHIGIGVSCNVESTGIGPFEGARVKIDPSGQIAVYTGVVSTGQGHETVLAQVCADVFSVDPGQITVRQGDTADIAFSRGTYHSRVAVAAGNAVHSAANRTRDKTVRFAAQILEASVEDLEVHDGQINVKGSPNASVTLAECAQRCIPGADRPDGMEPGLDESDYVEFGSVTWANAVHAATVSVDPATGQVDIIRYVVVHDCGRMLNPMIVRGQIQGGVAAGIGGTLLEEIVYDDEGQLITASLVDYLYLRSATFQSSKILHPDPIDNKRAWGRRRRGRDCRTPAAMAAAVEDALSPLGVRIRHSSLAPRHILAGCRGRALRARGSKRAGRFASGIGMRPAPFRYASPETLDDALVLLAQSAEEPKVLAGGQTLIAMMNFRLARPGLLVDLRRIPELVGINENQGWLRVGAMTTHTAVAQSPLVATAIPVMVNAARRIGHRAIRNRGTIGGSIAHADPAAEWPLVSVGLGARISCVSRRGTRSVAAADFFQSYFDTALEPDELITEVAFPALDRRCASSFHEFSRQSGAFGLVLVIASAQEPATERSSGSASASEAAAKSR